MVVGLAVPHRSLRDYSALQRRILPHAQVCSQWVDTIDTKQGYEKALGAEHTSTLGAVINLGNLYANQGKLVEAQQMYKRALQGYEKVFGPDHLKSREV